MTIESGRKEKQLVMPAVIKSGPNRKFPPGEGPLDRLRPKMHRLYTFVATLKPYELSSGPSSKVFYFINDHTGTWEILNDKTYQRRTRIRLAWTEMNRFYF